MQNKPDSSDDTIRQAMRMAKTPAGRELIAHLQKNGGAALTRAMNQAAGGDYTQAKALLTAMMADPEAQRLFREMGGE